MAASDSINQPATARPPTDRVFVNKRKIGRTAAVVFGVSILNLVIQVFLVLSHLLAPPSSGDWYVPGLAGGMITASIFGFLYGVLLLKSPIRACLDAEGIRIEWLVSRKRLSWAQIAELRRKKSSAPFGAPAGGGWGKQETKDILILCDERGKTLAEVDSALSDFPELVAEIEARSSAARGASTYDRDAQQARQLRSQKRSARLLAVAGGFFLVVGLGGGIFTWVDHQKERRLATEGVVTDATVARHYMYNVTPHLEYEFTDEQDRAFKRDAVMEPGAWDALEGQQTVAVRYLPADPDRSHLLIGEEESFTPPFFLMMAGTGLMTVLGALAWVAYFSGIADVKVERGKVRLVRVGQLDDSLEPDAAAPKARAIASPPPFPPPTPIVPRPAEPAFLLGVEPPSRSLPPGIKAVAILNIVFGLGGMLLNAARFAFSAWVVDQGGIVNVGDDYVFEVGPDVIQWARVEHVVCFGLALLLGCSAIGLFRARSWGRTLALAAVCGQLLIGIVAIVGIFRGGISVEGLPPEHRVPAYVGLAGAMFLSLLGMAYPTVVLVVLCRRSARELFAADDRETAERFSG